MLFSFSFFYLMFQDTYPFCSCYIPPTCACACDTVTSVKRFLLWTFHNLHQTYTVYHACCVFQAACVLGINALPVTIKNIENSIIDYAWEHGLMKPDPPKHRTGYRVAVVGSGPSGLATAAQINKVTSRRTTETPSSS